MDAPISHSIVLTPPLDYDAFTLHANANADVAISAEANEPAGPFMRLFLDTTLLETYESPSYDEASAVALDTLSSLLASSPEEQVENEPAEKRRRVARRVSTDDDNSLGWMLSTLRSPQGDMRCRYRKGKCSNPRTLKKNGSLHTYCELHRQRSILNQRAFDQKKREKREKRDKRLCDDCRHGRPCMSKASDSEELLKRDEQQRCCEPSSKASDQPADDASVPPVVPKTVTPIKTEVDAV